MAPQSVQAFVTILCIGAAVLALWIAVTKPRLGPRDLRRALLHILASIAIGYAIAPGIRAIAAIGVPGAAFVGTFGLALPALTYMFLAAAWMMRVMRDFFHGARY
jgi:hypothetical protein